MEIFKQCLSFRKVDGSHRLMVGFVLSLGLVNLFFGEIVPAGGGFGWDGMTYADMVRNLGSMISEGRLSHYYAQRILPSAIVRGMLLVTGAPLTDTNIIRTFGTYNLTLLIFCVVVWKRITDHFSLPVEGRWVGFFGIFVNFINSKMTTYTPVSTDPTAVLVSLLLLLCYLKRKPIPLLLVTVAGSFVWQITGIYGAMLMLSMRMTLPENAINSTNSMFRSGEFVGSIRKLWLTVFVSSLIAYLIVAYILPTAAAQSDLAHLFERFFAGAPSLLAVAIALLMIFGSTRTINSIVSERRKIRLDLVALAVAGLLVPAAIVKLISNPELPNANSFSQVLQWVIFPLNGEGKFLLPMLTLTLTWGPAILLSINCWDEICVEIRRLGPGVMGVVAMTLPLGLVTEPRYVLGAWPFVVLALVLVLARIKTSGSLLYVFFALSIIYAQFWLKLNLAPWTGGDVDGLLEFPKQMLFMRYGPWMSWPAYLVQLPIVILSGIMLRKLLFRCSRG